MFPPSYPGSNSYGQPAQYMPAPAQQSSDAGLDSLLGLLKFMDKEDLQKLLDADEKVTDLIKGSKDLQQLNQDKLTAMASNRSLADYNLSFRPRIEEGKRQLAELSKEAETLRSKFDESRTKLESLNSAANTDTLLNLLESASMEAEDKSEDLLSNLNRSSIGVADFVQEYLAARQTYHMRKIKAEKLTALANRQYAQPRQQQQQAPPAWTPGQSYPYNAAPSYNPYN